MADLDGAATPALPRRITAVLIHCYTYSDRFDEKFTRNFAMF